LRAAAGDYARWYVFFARNGIEPTIIAYEDLIANRQAAVDKVASLFGLQGRAPIKVEDIRFLTSTAILMNWTFSDHI